MSAKKLRILIDADAAAKSQKSGIGFYTSGLISSLAKHDPKNIEVIAHYFNFLGRAKPNLPQLPNITYKQSRLIPRQLANLLRRLSLNIPYEFLTRTRADFIVFPNFLNRKTFFKSAYCVTIHDFTYIDYPEQVSAKNRKDLTKLIPVALKSAKFAVTISNTMAGQLKKVYPWFKNPVITELLPVDAKQNINLSDSKKTLTSLNITKPYILFIGNFEPRKNIGGLLDAYLLLPDELKGKYSLVLAGGKGWNDESLLKKLVDAKSKGADIIETGYVSDSDRAVLYNNAHVFAFPSFYEGYGLPLLEAMTYDAPTLSSNIPVLKEVAGDASYYCDPHNPIDISKKLSDVLSDNKLREQLIKSGHKVVMQRTWDKVAKRVIEAM